MAAPATLLYDGHCRLCIAGARSLERWARPASVELVDFQQAGVLARFPSLSHEECMRAIQLVEPGGRIRAGADAVAAVLLTRGLPFAWVRLYRLPGLRFLVDRLYDWIARNRYRLMGRSECRTEACALHARPASTPQRPRDVTSA